jgi:hypothetical protein
MRGATWAIFMMSLYFPRRIQRVQCSKVPLSPIRPASTRPAAQTIEKVPELPWGGQPERWYRREVGSNSGIFAALNGDRVCSLFTKMRLVGEA